MRFGGSRRGAGNIWGTLERLSPLPRFLGHHRNLNRTYRADSWNSMQAAMQGCAYERDASSGTDFREVRLPLTRARGWASGSM